MHVDNKLKKRHYRGKMELYVRCRRGLGISLLSIKVTPTTTLDDKGEIKARAFYFVHGYGVEITVQLASFPWLVSWSLAL